MTLELCERLGRAESWNVIGNGPSLADLESVGPGPTIAINGAAYHEAIQPEFWAVLESPTIVMGGQGEEEPRKALPPRAHQPMILSFAAHVPIWTEACPGCRVYGVADTRAELEAAIPFATDAPWGHWTTLFACAIACIRGAKHIRIYAADMYGKGGAYGPTKWRLNGRRDADRWERELLDLEHAQADARKAGVVIERVAS